MPVKWKDFIKFVNRNGGPEGLFLNGQRISISTMSGRELNQKDIKAIADALNVGNAEAERIINEGRAV